MVGSPLSLIFMSLLCQLTGSTASRDLEELVGALGGSVTFPLNSSVKQIGSIVWIFNTTLLTLQPQEPNKSAVMIVTQSHKKERVSFPNRGYSLTLSKLQKNDSGIYRVEIHSLFQQRPFTQEYVLRVYEHLSKPKVTMGLQKKKNGTCMTNLTCSMEQGGEDVTYSWKTANESHDGSILPISWTLGEKNMTFICMARNPISRNFSNPISSWNLCEGAAGETDAPKFILYLLLVPILLIVFVLGFFTWSGQRDRGKENDPRGRPNTYQSASLCLPNRWKNPIHCPCLWTHQGYLPMRISSKQQCTLLVSHPKENKQKNLLTLPEISRKNKEH
ncbi:SLAM family member 7 isoform X6 [Trichechus manatus latirostris]|uniref:SLAM family member 7 isoform X6 n=1 Tax=Trichechus manatus latirostris TaxID=127582 RepID=A0A2Y9QHE3_TRIMA|nr:SLAM family member 7 isoform X6 [Trichechus manatus latirostris]